MKELNIAGKTVKVDTEKLAEGMYEMHVEGDCLAPLAFGMLDAKLMDMFEKDLSKKIFAQFTPEDGELFKSRIKAFIRDVQKAVSVGIYNRAEMVV